MLGLVPSKTKRILIHWPNCTGYRLITVLKLHYGIQVTKLQREAQMHNTISSLLTTKPAEQEAHENRTRYPIKKQGLG